MTHTYGTVRGFQDYLRDNGSGDLGSDIDPVLLSRLQSASRTVDAFCDRGPSGFGPRSGTNRYLADGCDELELDDDLVSVTSITRLYLDGTGSTALSASGYYLDPVNTSPKRRVILMTETFGSGWIDVLGVWGYQNTTDTAVATLNGATNDTATAVILSADPDIAGGNTILVGSEQLYVRSVDGTVATVERGANGTTAASHTDASAISVYSYHPDVVEATYAIAAKRMRSRDAGLIPDFGGQGASVMPRDTERSLLRALVGHLKVYGA